MIEREFPEAGHYAGTIVCPTGSVSSIVAGAWVSVRAAGGAEVAVWFQRSADSDDAPPEAGAAWQGSVKNAQRGWSEVPDGCEFIEYSIDAGGPGALTVEMKAQ